MYRIFLPSIRQTFYQRIIPFGAPALLLLCLGLSFPLQAAEPGADTSHPTLEQIVILLQKAGEAPEEERARLLVEADDKMQKMASSTPDDDTVWFIWGSIAVAQASATPSFQEKSRLWSHAEERFRRAVAIQPESQEGWRLLGIALRAQAKLADSDSEKQQLQKEAEEIFQKLNAPMPQETPEEIPEKTHTTLLFEVIDFMSKAEELEKDPEENKKERLLLWQKSADNLEKIYARVPKFPQLWPMWGLALAKSSVLVDDPEEGQRLWQQAEEKFQKALETKDVNMPETWLTWAAVLSERAAKTSGDEQETLWRDAEMKLEKAKELGDSRALYNLACLSCLRNKKESCLAYLQNALDDGSLLKIGSRHMANDKDLALVQATPEFAAILAGLKRKEAGK